MNKYRVKLSSLLLFFAIFAPGMVIGMKPEKPELNPKIWGQLPYEVKKLIIMALAQSDDNINEAIKNIVKTKEVNKELNATINSLEGFTKIIHMLADKFGKSTQEVALLFDTQIAKEYVKLGGKFNNSSRKYVYLSCY